MEGEDGIGLDGADWIGRDGMGWDGFLEDTMREIGWERMRF